MKVRVQMFLTCLFLRACIRVVHRMGGGGGDGDRDGDKGGDSWSWCW